MGRLVWSWMVAAGGILTPALAQAETKFELGGRLGYGIALGKADGDSDLNEGITGQIPIWLDLGARFSERFFLGGYFAYGFGFVGDEFEPGCDAAEAAGADCLLTARDLRFGLQAHYHLFADGKRADPWVGAGIGYEIVSWSFALEQGGSEADLSFKVSGFEFLNLQFGVDFPLSEHVALGPFAVLTLGQYSDTSVDCSGDCGDFSDTDGDIEDKALHEWLFLGARIAVLP